MIDIQKYKPTNAKKSDKYSINFYKWLKKHKNWPLWAYAPQWSNIDGSFVAFNFDDPKSSQIYIGFMDDDSFLTGQKLSDILCGVGQTYCYAPGCNREFFKNMIDISDWFFSEYEKIGRALWDASGENFMIDADDRFTVIGNTKRCNWSGRWYKKEIVTHKKTERFEQWVRQ